MVVLHAGSGWNAIFGKIAERRFGPAILLQDGALVHEREDRVADDQKACDVVELDGLGGEWHAAVDGKDADASCVDRQRGCGVVYEVEQSREQVAGRI